MKLYQHQDRFMAKLRAALKKYRKILAVAPTGFGKSTIIAEMFAAIYEKGNSAWFIIHRVELREQVEKILQRAGVPYGLVVAGVKYDPTKDIQICMAQTLKNRIGLMKKPKLVFLDEAHISCSNTYKKILSHLPDAYVIGGTATPQRTDRKPMGEIYENLVLSEDTRWLIEHGYLSKYKLFRPTKLSLGDVEIKRGDYDQKQLAINLDKSKITGDSLEHYIKLSKGKKFIIFDYSVKASRESAILFTDAGFPCMHVDADTPKDERKSALERFRNGELMGLSNYALFTEGVDIPDIECVILKRPTKSIIVYRQSVGRGLRKTHDEKILTILDHAGASLEHGLPCDEIEWSLDGKKKKTGPGITPTKTCMECFAVVRAGAGHCQECGAVFEKIERTIEVVDGALEEVDIIEARKHRKALINKAETLKDFQRIARQLNYKSGWAFHEFRRKQQRSTNPSKRSAGIQQRTDSLI